MFAEVDMQEILKHISIRWLSLQKCVHNVLNSGVYLLSRQKAARYCNWRCRGYDVEGMM